MQDEKVSEEYNQDIENFILIEKNMENKFANKYIEDELDFNGEDEIVSLNGIINIKIIIKYNLVDNCIC